MREEGFFVRLRLLIKTSLCSQVLLAVLMRIKKPKSVCVVEQPKGVGLYVKVLVGFKCVRVCVYVHSCCV